MICSWYLTLDTNDKVPKKSSPEVEKYHVLIDYLVKL